MKRLLTATLTIMGLLTLLSTSVYAEYFEISDYVVDVKVSEENSYDVTETIMVAFASERHGIFREIPRDYGKQIHNIYDIQVIDPTTGNPYTFEVIKERQMVTIKVGDADIYVNGNVAYEISYTYDVGTDLDDSMDEFYFNVIGTEWPVNIQKANFTIEMPADFDATDVNITSGRFGSSSTDNVEFVVDGRTITGNTLSSLSPDEGVTVALPLDEGYYSVTSSNYNVIPFYILLIIALGCAFLVFTKRQYYKNRNIIVPVVTFDAPDGLNPPELSYIFHREQVSTEDMMTLVISWASRGYLIITEQSKTFGADTLTFEKTNKDSSDLKSYERSLFSSMFNCGSVGRVSTDQLKYRFSDHINKAIMSLRSQYVKDKEILINSVQWLTKLASLGMMLLLIIGISYIFTAFYKTSFMSNFILFGIVFGSLWIINTIISYASGKSVLSKFILPVLVIIAGVILDLTEIADVTRIFALIQNHSDILLVAIILFVLLCIYGSATSLLIESYTDYGKDIVGKVEGFKNFLAAAESDQMEMMFEQNHDYYYDILPYAMVLNLTSIWEKQVSTLTLEQPDWYRSSRPFAAAHFTHTMHSAFQSASAVESKSSSSGGSSGGGGGGGGGGSW